MCHQEVFKLTPEVLADLKISEELTSYLSRLQLHAQSSPEPPSAPQSPPLVPHAPPEIRDEEMGDDGEDESDDAEDEEEDSFEEDEDRLGVHHVSPCAHIASKMVLVVNSELGMSIGKLCA
ncbi:unnamed protein product, partial [Cyprideis torosa]